MQPKFSGFTTDKPHLVPVPEELFVELLPQIDHLGELKLTFYLFWLLEHQEGSIHYFTCDELLDDPLFVKAMGGNNEEEARKEVNEALGRAVSRGSLLLVRPQKPRPDEGYYFINSARGRAAAEAMTRGEWSPESRKHRPSGLSTEEPNIFRLYEENIGPLTPLIADSLREAESAYPRQWIEDAIRIAVVNNVRRWRYVEAILNSWKEKGRDEAYPRDAEEDRFRYIKGKYGKFGEH